MVRDSNHLAESARKNVVQASKTTAWRKKRSISQLQAKQAHRNVKGPNFVGPHDLFDRVADAAREYVD